MASIEKRRCADGAWQYRVKIRVKGAPAESASFQRLTDARRWAQSTESAIRGGSWDFTSTEAKKHTLAETIDRYVKEILPHKAKGGANQTAQLAWWRNRIGAYALSNITRDLICDCRDRLLQDPICPKAKTDDDIPSRRRSPATVVRYLAALSHVFSVAVKEWGWLGKNPVAKVSKPKVANGRVRFLNNEERQHLLDAVEKTSKPLYVVVVLALSTGMRRGEILSLRWSQVDFPQRRITLHKTKNGEIRSVPLTGVAYELLAELGKVRLIDCNLVFMGEVANRPFCIQKPWYASLKAAGIENFRFHDLRHCAASYMAMNGASLLDIATVLGHKTLSMAMRYSHLSDEHTQRVVKAMNERIFAASPIGGGRG